MLTGNIHLLSEQFAADVPVQIIPTLTDADVVQGIQQTFEQNLFQLPPRIQGHYGIRLYRLTGMVKYLHAALYDYFAVADQLNAILPYINNPAHINTLSKSLAALLSKNERGKARSQTLRKYPDFIFYADALLRYASRLDEFGVRVPDKVLKVLSSYDFKSAITNKAMIHAWAAQLANYAYWLKQLGIADYVEATRLAFLTAYPDEEDTKLSKWEYNNKLYGLTHYVLAASGYYQHSLEKEEFNWALDYFVNNLERIFATASADIIAEIGISFLLTGQGNHDLVAQAKDKIIRSYNNDHGMIPSVNGKFDLATGEHRNVLALMLLSWPNTLYPGPYFHQIKSISKYLPKSPSHWLTTESPLKLDSKN